MVKEYDKVKTLVEKNGYNRGNHVKANDPILLYA